MVEAAILSDQQPHQISFKATADTLTAKRHRDRPANCRAVNDHGLQVGQGPTENRERSSDDLNPTKD